MTDQAYPMEPASVEADARALKSARGSLTTGILGAFFGLTVPIPVWGLFMLVLAAPLSIIAVVLGHSSLKANAETGRRSAIAGLVLGYLTIAVCVAVTAFWIVQMSIPR